ncbi:MAG: YggS family pyridoxal phosphate-dependent enzyme [Anaerolineae bacterium]|nr:YggS family pyridoxal phosphate-dependent enzyme [Anaerolineae bacterium]
MSDVARKVELVRQRIGEAAVRAGRDPDDVLLVAVTKTQPIVAILDAYQAGLRHFGENRVEEGQEKIPAVHSALRSGDGHLQGDRHLIIWHMIGHIQSRKAQPAVAYFDYVHSVDRVKIAHRLSHFAHQLGRTLPVLLECNISGESTKFGFDLMGWEQDEARRSAFLAAVEEILALPGLDVQGLMTMAPLVDDAEETRPIFASLRALLELLREHFPAHTWRHLSMGMTDDFEVAVEEGATMVRIGRAIFGELR